MYNPGCASSIFSIIRQTADREGLKLARSLEKDTYKLEVFEVRECFLFRIFIILVARHTYFLLETSTCPYTVCSKCIKGSTHYAGNEKNRIIVYLVASRSLDTFAAYYPLPTLAMV